MHDSCRWVDVCSGGVLGGFAHYYMEGGVIMEHWLDELEMPESHLNACKLEAARIYKPLTLTAADQAKLNKTLDELFGNKK